MRVSTDSDRQHTDLQRDALLAAGVDERNLFEDRASGAKDERSGLTRALGFVRPGDVLAVLALVMAKNRSNRLGFAFFLTFFREYGIPPRLHRSRSPSRQELVQAAQGLYAG